MNVVRIPVRKAGGEFVYALVDAEDAAKVLAFTWRLNYKGYAVSKRDGRDIKMHRLILGLVPGDGLECDHINRNRLDNRRENLRAVTRAQNGQNREKIRGSSRYRGVSWKARKQKWVAQACLNYQVIHIGYFDSEDEAGRAAAEWRRQHMPFACN